MKSLKELALKNAIAGLTLSAALEKSQSLDSDIFFGSREQILILLSETIGSKIANHILNLRQDLSLTELTELCHDVSAGVGFAVHQESIVGNYFPALTGIISIPGRLTSRRCYLLEFQSEHKTSRFVMGEETGIPQHLLNEVETMVKYILKDPQNIMFRKSLTLEQRNNVEYIFSLISWMEITERLVLENTVSKIKLGKQTPAELVSYVSTLILEICRKHLAANPDRVPENAVRFLTDTGVCLMRCNFNMRPIEPNSNLDSNLREIEHYAKYKIPQERSDLVDLGAAIYTPKLIEGIRFTCAIDTSTGNVRPFGKVHKNLSVPVYHYGILPQDGTHCLNIVYHCWTAAGLLKDITPSDVHSLYTNTEIGSYDVYKRMKFVWRELERRIMPEPGWGDRIIEEHFKNPKCMYFRTDTGADYKIPSKSSFKLFIETVLYNWGSPYCDHFKRSFKVRYSQECDDENPEEITIYVGKFES